MGLTNTPINGFPLPDDNEPLANVYAMARQLANLTEAALRGRGLTSADVTGYLDLVGQVNNVKDDTGWLPLTPMNGAVPVLYGMNYRVIGKKIVEISARANIPNPYAANTVVAKIPNSAHWPLHRVWSTTILGGGAFVGLGIDETNGTIFLPAANTAGLFACSVFYMIG